MSSPSNWKLIEVLPDGSKRYRRWVYQRASASGSGGWVEEEEIDPPEKGEKK